MKIIYKKNINEIINLYKTKNQLVIFGKGPSYKPNIIKKENQIFACVNDSINHIDNCDFLIVNDLKNFKKIDDKKLKNVTNLIIPYHIHINWKADINFTYINVIEQLKDKFNNNLIVYNLRTINKNYKEFINLNTCMSGTHNIVEFNCSFLKMKHIITYGIGKGSNYHKLFINTVTKEHLDIFCNKKRVNQFNKKLNQLCKDIKLEIL